MVHKEKDYLFISFLHQSSPRVSSLCGESTSTEKENPPGSKNLLPSQPCGCGVTVSHPRFACSMQFYLRLVDLLFII